MMIAAHGDRIVASGYSSVKLYNADTPLRQHPLGAGPVAVARSRSRAAAVDASGMLHLFDDAGAAIASKRVTVYRPMALVAHDDRIFALDSYGFKIFDRGGAMIQHVDVLSSIAMAIDPDGTIVIVGDNCKLTEWTGTELVDIPPSAEQIHAIVPLGNRRFACLGQPNWFLLDLAQREMESIDAQVISHPYVASSPSGRRLAWFSEDRTIAVGRLDGTKLVVERRVTYPKTFGRIREVLGFVAIEPIEAQLFIHGFAFLDDDHLAISINYGRGNIIDLQGEPVSAARKLDEHEGEEHASWQFEYQGQSLIAR